MDTHIRSKQELEKVRHDWGFRMYKTHDPSILRTYKSIYMFRHPCDVLTSYYYFQKASGFLSPATGLDIDDFCRINLPDWKAHIHTAVQMSETASAPIHFLSYEQLAIDPERALVRILEYLGINSNDSQNRKAVQECSIGKLQHAANRETQSKLVFRKGQIGSGLNELSATTYDYIMDTAGLVYAEVREQAL